MTTAAVFGQSDVPVTHKDGKLLTSIGDMFACGEIFPWAEGSQAVLQRFSGSGGNVFHSTIRTPPAFANTEHGMTKCLIDSNNHLYAIASITGDGDDNLIKLDVSNLDGEQWNLLWSTRVGASDLNITIEDMCFDINEDILIVGYCTDGISIPSQGDQKFFWKVDSDGNEDWNKATPDGRCHRVAIDSNGNIYLTCDRQDQDSIGNSAGCLQKYNSSGTFQWGWDSGYDVSNGWAVAVSSADEIFVSTRYSVTDGGNRWLIYEFNTSGVEQNKLASHKDPDLGITEYVDSLKFDFDDQLYYVELKDAPNPNTFILHKTQKDFTHTWTKTLESTQWSKHKIDVSFLNSREVFITTLPTPIDFEEQHLRSESNGALLWERVRWFVTHGSGRHLPMSPVFHSPKPWIHMKRYWDAGGKATGALARMPVYDSGCFINPTYPYFLTDGHSEAPASMEVGDIFFVYGWKQDGWIFYPFDRGLIRNRKTVDTEWDPFLCFQEGEMKRLCRTIPKPFQIWPFIGDVSNTFAAEWLNPLLAYHIGVHVYYDGNYYKCKAYNGQFHTPTGVTDTWWTKLTAPSPTWNSFTGFGGLGEFDSYGTTPQIYTVVFHNVDDMDGVLHKLNGVFYFEKDLGGDHESIWFFSRSRPGGQAIYGVFVMCGGIENIGPQEFSMPECWIKLEMTWLHEIAWSAGITYEVGDKLIYSGTDDVQIAYTCILQHANQEPPNATYWEVQTEPWDTWSVTFEYDSDDYCLHKGEWYRCLGGTQTVTLDNVVREYNSLAPGAIGDTVLEYDTGTPIGELLEYDQTTDPDYPTWTIASDDAIAQDLRIVVPGVSGGHGYAETASAGTGGPHSGVEPPDAFSWLHVPVGHDDYPTRKVVFQSDDEEKNYGCMYDWCDAANQGLGGMIGQDGTASVYPGAVYQWASVKTYVTDDIVVWNGRFYKASSGSTDSEPPSGNWTLLGTTS